MFKHLSIKGKMLAGFGFTILVALAVASIAIFSMYNSSRVGAQMRQLINVEVAQLFKVHSTYNQVHSWLHDVQSKPSPQLVNEGISLVDNLAAVIDKLPQGTFDNEVNAAKSTLNNLVSAINNTQFKLLLTQGHYQQAERVFLRDILPFLTTSNRELSGLIYSYTNEVTGFANDLDMRSNIYWTIGITVVGTIIAIIIAISLHHYIVGNTYHILKFARQIESGDFNIKLSEKDIHKDEIGDIYRSFADIAKTLNLSVARTIAISEALNGNANTLCNASNAVTSGATDTEQRALTVAAASDEMVSTTSDIAKNCHAAQETSETARLETNNGVDKVRVTVMRIKEQAENTREDATKVIKLAEQSQRIGSIVGTIEDIAAQTNLLALNAAIEAARAGEAGRGFAVVADEVRALASRTAESTKEISAMVAGVQSDSEEATNSMNSSVEQMTAVAEEAADLENTLANIRDAVNAVNDQIIQIASAAEEQINATAEISNNMQGISEMAQQSVDVAGNAANVARYCNTLINGLLDELDFFKLNDSQLRKEDLTFTRIDADTEASINAMNAQAESNAVAPSSAS